MYAQRLRTWVWWGAGLGFVLMGGAASFALGPARVESRGQDGRALVEDFARAWRDVSGREVVRPALEEAQFTETLLRPDELAMDPPYYRFADGHPPPPPRVETPPPVDERAAIERVLDVTGVFLGGDGGVLVGRMHGPRRTQATFRPGEWLIAGRDPPDAWLRLVAIEAVAPGAWRIVVDVHTSRGGAFLRRDRRFVHRQGADRGETVIRLGG